jgi:hypothetical protein
MPGHQELHVALRRRKVTVIVVADLELAFDRS